MNTLGREGPLQNRVTPFGDIVAIPQRGIFTGNRGIIHDPATKTLLRKRWASKAWLICRCDYKGRRRDVMAGRSWTELFFLDEAVALAAGALGALFSPGVSDPASRWYALLAKPEWTPPNRWFAPETLGVDRRFLFWIPAKLAMPRYQRSALAILHVIE